MRKWQISLLVTIILFGLGALGVGWTYRPIVDYHIDNPPETVKFYNEPLTFRLMARNRGKTDTSLILVVTVENAVIYKEKVAPYMEYTETELKIPVGLPSDMQGYSVYEVDIIPRNNPQNFTITYSIVDISGLSISGIISHLFLEPHSYYATHLTYKRTDRSTYALGLLPPPPTHTLSISSSPVTDMGFTLNGVHHIAPYSTTLNEGIYIVVMPSTVIIKGTTYNFVKWQDGSTNPTRTIYLTSDTTLTVFYEKQSV